MTTASAQRIVELLDQGIDEDLIADHLGISVKRVRWVADELAAGRNPSPQVSNLSPAAARKTGRPAPSSANCGTVKSHQQHVRRGETPCGPCAQARRDYDAGRRARRRATKPADPKPLPANTPAPRMRVRSLHLPHTGLVWFWTCPRHPLDISKPYTDPGHAHTAAREHTVECWRPR